MSVCVRAALGFPMRFGLPRILQCSPISAQAVLALTTLGIQSRLYEAYHRKVSASYVFWLEATAGTTSDGQSSVECMALLALV